MRWTRSTLVCAGLIALRAWLPVRLTVCLLASLVVCLAMAAPKQVWAADPCRGTVYLTFDTGNMRHAELIADILRRHKVRATFFLANEKTSRGDFALDPSWAGYWKQLTVEGHAFGTHTWHHGRFAGDLAHGAVRYRPQFGTDAGRTLTLDAHQVCTELRRVDETFESLTGRTLDALWRAPGGHLTANALAAAHACGYAHVHWARAGFLGDELPSDRFPNPELLARALRDVRDGDVLMAHLGIWSRRDPYAPMVDPLIAGLKQRGMCFRTLREHPEYRAAPDVLPALSASRAR